MTLDINGKLKPGSYFMQGNEACAEGAIAVGCDFFCRLSNYTIIRGCRKNGKKIATNWESIYSDGG